MQAKISKRVVDTAATAAGSDELWVWDVELKGFGLRVRSNGRKTYVLEYRPGRRGRSAQKRRVTIGTHGSPWTPDQARKEALRLLGLVAGGGDPAADKAAGNKAPRVEELIERFLSEHVEAKRKASTAKEYRRLLEKFVKPAVGHKQRRNETDGLLRSDGTREPLPIRKSRLQSSMSRSISGPERYSPIGGVEAAPDPPLTTSTIALRTIGENGVCKIRTHHVSPCPTFGDGEIFLCARWLPGGYRKSQYTAVGTTGGR
jgi:hypothetical protein